MLRRSKAAVSFVLAAFSLMMVGTPDANAGSKLPDPIKAGVAEKLFSLTAMGSNLSTSITYISFSGFRVFKAQRLSRQKRIAGGVFL
jgi:hypothetical protein